MNGLRLKSVRIARGLTSKKMAEEIGRCEASWNQRERGEKIPNLHEVAVITKVLDLNEQEFLDIFFDSNLPYRKKPCNSCLDYNHFITRR